MKDVSSLSDLDIRLELDRIEAKLGRLYTVPPALWTYEELETHRSDRERLAALEFEAVQRFRRQGVK